MPIGLNKDQYTVENAVLAQPQNVLPVQVASFVDPVDRLPAYIALLAYDDVVPSKVIGTYYLVKKTHRMQMWVSDVDRTIIIGVRGTGPGQQGFGQDLKDALLVAGLRLMDSCAFGVVNEVRRDVENAVQSGYNVVVCGHSLGGSAAMCLGDIFPSVRVVSFNGGAPPTNPKKRGPGPQRATHYHIEGDIISSHMASTAAKVVRVRVQNIGWTNKLAAHKIDRFFESVPWTYILPQQEQQTWRKYSIWPPKHPILSALILASPIPN